MQCKLMQCMLTSIRNDKGSGSGSRSDKGKGGKGGKGKSKKGGKGEGKDEKQASRRRDTRRRSAER